MGELNPDEQRDVERLDALLLLANQDSDRTRARFKELRWMMRINLALLVPIFVSLFFLDIHDADKTNHALFVATYAAIVGVVVAGWGDLRSGLGYRQSKRGIFVVYMLLFTFLFVLFGILLLMLKGKFAL